MATLTKPAVEVTDRRTDVASVLASFNMEGLEPDAETASLLQQYAVGTLSAEQLGSAIERHVAGMNAGRPAKGAAR